jgi:hypothetical protein
MRDGDLAESIRRGFSRYSLDGSVDDLRDRARPRALPRLALPAASAVTVAAVAVGALLLAMPLGGDMSGSTLAPERAFASWTPDPAPVPGSVLADAKARCEAADSRGAALPLAATEQRGSYTLIFRADAGKRAVCIAGPEDELLVLSPGPVTDPPLEDLPPTFFPISEAVFPGPGNPMAGRIGLVVGRVGAGVDGVTIDSREAKAVAATISRGYFVAWWPGTADGAAHATIEARDAADGSRATFRLLREDVSLAEFVQDPVLDEPFPAQMQPAGATLLLARARQPGREIVVYPGNMEGDFPPVRCPPEGCG